MNEIEEAVIKDAFKLFNRMASADDIDVVSLWHDKETNLFFCSVTVFAENKYRQRVVHKIIEHNTDMANAIIQCYTEWIFYENL